MTRVALAVVALGGLLAAGWTWRAESVDAALRLRRAAVRELVEHEPPVFRLGDRHVHDVELATSAVADLRDPDHRDEGVPRHESDPLPAIVHFRDELAARGVDLVVMPVPNRPLVLPEMTGWAPSLLGPTRAEAAGVHTRFVDALQEAGVEVVDLLPALQAAAAADPATTVHVADSHWTAHGVTLAAEQAAAVLREGGWLDDAPPLATSDAWVEREREIVIGKAYGVDLGRETFTVHRITAADGGRLDVVGGAGPVLVLGDSYVDWYEAVEGDFARQLAHATATPIASLVVHAGGATRVRRELVHALAADPQVLEGRRVVLWVFDESATVRRAWGITRLDPWPAPRAVSAASAGIERVLIDGGVQQDARLDDRWFPPQAQHDVAGLRTPSGEVTFVAPPSGAASLVLEARSLGGGETVQVSLDDRPLGAFPIGADPHQRTRHRLPIPAGWLGGTHRLRFDVHRPHREYAFGIVRLALAGPGPHHREAMASMPPGRGFLGVERAGPESFAWAGDRVRLDLQVAEPPAVAALRLRLRTHPAIGDAAVRLAVRGRPVATLRVGGRFTEHVVALPDGVLTDGSVPIRLVLDPGAVPDDAPDTRIAWEMLEIDALPTK